MTEDITDIRRTIAEIQEKLREQGEAISRLERQQHWRESSEKARRNYGDGQNP